MVRHAATLVRFAGATTLAAGLLLCTTGSSQAQEASDHARAQPRVELAAEGVYGSFRPTARVTIDRPGYVALFEVEPGVGATMLYPDDPVDPERFAAGTHELRLNGLPAATRRRLMAWHFGWAFVHRTGLALDNHLVAVVSEEPLDVSELRSKRIFRYTKGSAGAGEVTGALLSTVAGHLSAQRWDAAHDSYAKFRDPWLLATSGPWLDAPFLPLGRILAFTGWPPLGSSSFLFTCGPTFAATGGFFRGTTAHDLHVCRHAIPERRLLADLSRQDPRARAAGVAEANAREASGRAEEPLSEEVREALRRLADATERSRDTPELRSLRHLESIGQAMKARGFRVDDERLSTVRWKAETRARMWNGIGAGSGAARGIPFVDRDLDARRRGVVRGKNRSLKTPERSPDRARPKTLPAKKPGSKKPRKSGDGSGNG